MRAKRDAVRGLPRRRQHDEAKRDRLRALVKAGIDALDRGAFSEIDDAGLDAALDDLVSRRSLTRERLSDRARK